MSADIITMNPHRDSALNTPEILEHMLLQMDMRSLLAAQRVCRTWHHIITEVPSLRRKLFFEPAPESSVRVKNPLLSELFPQWFSYGEWANRREVFGPGDLKNLAFVSDELNSAFQYNLASWKRMLLTQPPIQSFTRCTNSYFEDGDGCSLSTISVDNETCYTHMMGGWDRKEADRTGNPLRMEEFYRLVTRISYAFGWLFIWDTDPNQQSLQVGGIRMMDITREQLENDLRRDGLVMFEKTSAGCTLECDIVFGEEYHVDGELLSFLDELQKAMLGV